MMKILLFTFIPPLDDRPEGRQGLPWAQ
jgi:hypothetical protein